jgi:hypothetical protein
MLPNPPVIKTLDRPAQAFWAWDGKRWLLALIGLVCGVYLGAGQKTVALPLPANLIDLNSTAGESLLFASRARADFLPLSSQFQTQKTPSYCGVASSIMVLNALGLPAPIAVEYAPYSVFTQDNFFTPQAEQVVTAAVVQRRGMTLAQLAGLLSSHGAVAAPYHASDLNLGRFRQLMIRNLQEPHNFVVVNYLRRSIGQERGGHISPVAAYHQASDRFLILDVSRYKYPPVWVKATELWSAINTIDSDSGKTRGIVLISKDRNRT